MDIQTGKLYWMQYTLFKSTPPELVVIIDISEERNRISYYYVNTGRSYYTFLDTFADKYFLSPT